MIAADELRTARAGVAQGGEQDRGIDLERDRRIRRDIRGWPCVFDPVGRSEEQATDFDLRRSRSCGNDLHA